MPVAVLRCFELKQELLQGTNSKGKGRAKGTWVIRSITNSPRPRVRFERVGLVAGVVVETNQKAACIRCCNDGCFDPGWVCAGFLRIATAELRECPLQLRSRGRLWLLEHVRIFRVVLVGRSGGRAVGRLEAFR